MRRMRTLLTALALLAGVTALDVAPAAALDTYTVTTTADVVDGGDGVLSLREAFTAANGDLDASTIVLGSGLTYQLTICDGGAPNETANASGDLNLRDDDSTPVVLEGNGSTVVQTCDDERVLETAGAATTISDLTVTGGDLVTGSGLTGGGIEASVLTLVDVTVSGNGAPQGGGLNGRILDLTRVRVSGNTAGSGGGMLLGGSFPQLTLTDSSVTANTAGSVPGIQFDSPGSATIVNSTIGGSTQTVANFGLGSELNLVGDATITHSTVVGTANGAPLRVSGALTAFGLVVASGGSTGTCVGMGTTTSQGHNVESLDVCGFDQTSDLVDQPTIGLGPLADNGGAGETFLPTDGGILDDAIPAAECLLGVPADARGVERPSGAGCEPGAVERVPVRRADAQIRTSAQTTFGGNDVVNTSGAGQSRLLVRARNQKATFVVRAQNDGEATDDLHIKGPASGSGFTVRYFAGSTNVTSAVVAGTHTVADLAPGATATVRVEVTPVTGSRPGQTRNLLIRATSVADPAQKDVVKASVRRT